MPLTEDYTYMLGDSGVVLNTTNIATNFVDILKVQGLDNAPIRTTERDHEGTDGGFMDAEFEKGRPVVLEGTVYAINGPMEPFLDTLKSNWAPSTTPIPFYFKKPGVAERMMFIKPLGCRYDVDQSRRLDMTQIQFSGYAEDPRIYDATLTSTTISQGETIVVGRGYPKSYSYSYGSNAAPVGQNLIVSGNRPTPPIFVINGPLVNPQIINETTGESMIFDITLNDTDVMTVDIKNRSVSVNGQNRRAALRLPNWFFLMPGANFIRFRAESTNFTNGSIANANPSFESGTSSYSTVNATAVSSTAQVHSGTSSAFVTPDGVGATPRIESFTVVTNAKRHKVSAWIRPTTANKNPRISMQIFDTNNTFLATRGTTIVTAVAGTWQYVESPIINVSDLPGAVRFSASASLDSGGGSAPAVTDTFYVDEVSLIPMIPSSMSVQYRSAWR